MPGEAPDRPTPLQALQGLYHCGAPAEDWPALLATLPARVQFVPGQFDPAAPVRPEHGPQAEAAR